MPPADTPLSNRFLCANYLRMRYLHVRPPGVPVAQRFENPVLHEHPASSDLASRQLAVAREPPDGDHGGLQQLGDLLGIENDGPVSSPVVVGPAHSRYGNASLHTSVRCVHP